MLLSRLVLLLMALPVAAGAYTPPEPLSDVTCDSPVIMLVQGEVQDAKKIGAYGQALRDSNAYGRQQGYYMFSGLGPMEIFEGERPANAFTFGAHFPCAEAARGFWFGELYQSIRELRRGATRVTVTLFPVLPAPEGIGSVEPELLYPPQPTQPNPE